MQRNPTIRLIELCWVSLRSTQPTVYKMKVLELDSGNTRLKWRLIREGKILSRGVVENNEDWSVRLPELFDQLGAFQLARISVVSGCEKHNLLSDIITGGFGIPVQIARTKACSQGLAIAYSDSSALGVDRWLAMLAAHHQPEKGVKIIVDSGTALTVDVVNPEGKHIGGYIVPGIQLMKQSLQLNTAKLLVKDGQAEGLSPGKNTLQCIDHGVVLMATSMIHSVIAGFDDVTVYLTGGSVQLLQPYIDAKSKYLPELVMDGLAFAFKES